MAFRVELILRVILIITLLLAAICIIYFTPFWLTGVWFIMFSLWGIYSLIIYAEKYRRELTNLIIALRQDDLSMNYSGRVNSKELKEAFSVISESFSTLREENASNINFLSAVVEHISVPLLGYWVHTGRIKLINRAAAKLFNQSRIVELDDLNKISADLVELIKRLEAGQKDLLKLTINNKNHHLSISASEVIIMGRRLKLISMQDIKAELDEQELISFKKLIRVLTHEIKNSAIPISTLTEVVHQMIVDDKGNLKDISTFNETDKEDLIAGIKTVEKRSKGLVRFVDNYSQLARIPKPEIVEFDLIQLTYNTLALLKSELKNIEIEVIADLKKQFILADEALIGQVLINLLKNAKEALENSPNPKIIIKSITKGHKSILEIIDNGPGIDEEVLENIFVPFFTTKKGGSGIGLSLSAQIIKAHNGTIEASSTNGGGATFSIAL